MENNILTDHASEAPFRPDEPAALAALRQNAWQRFNQLDYAKANDERWRFSAAPAPKLQNYAAPPPPANRAVQEEIIARSDLVKDAVAGNIFYNGHLIHSRPLPAELAAKGVTLETLEEALRRTPALAETLLRTAPLGSEKYLALHYARLGNGYVLRVPAGVEIAAPIVNYNWVRARDAALFPHALILAEANSRINVVDFHLATSEHASNTFSVSAADVFAGPGAKVTRTSVQNWSASSRSFQVDTTRAERDAEITTIALNLGSGYARLENEVRLLGPGATVHPRALTVATGKQRFDQRTLQIHEAPGSASNLLFKNALLDASRTIFSGLIQVAPGAQRTDAYQTNRNLLLSHAAEAISLPGLEIAANDVKCSHGATNSEIDSDELFYLRARGIQDAVARELLVFGFFEEVLAQAGSETVTEALRSLIRKKLGHEQ